jgi:hypothetical protein
MPGETGGEEPGRGYSMVPQGRGEGINACEGIPEALKGKWCSRKLIGNYELRKGMNKNTVTGLDRLLATICEGCPVCRHARKKQHGVAFQLVSSVEERICPFCRAYEKVHGRKAHEAY